MEESSQRAGESRGLPRIGERRLPMRGCVAASVLHESALVQVTAWRCLRDGPALQAERVQTDHVLTLLRVGACDVEQGRRRTTLDPGRALWHRPGSTYRTRHPQGHGDAGWSVAFAPEVAEELLREAQLPARSWQRPSRALTVDWRRSLPLHLALQRLERSRPVDPLGLDEGLLAAAGDWLGRDTAQPALSAAHRRLGEAARAHVNASFRGRVRLAEVASALGCSPFHLSRVFRRVCGVTLAEHVRRLRVAHVLESLAEGHSSLTELALEAGFASHAHLTDSLVRIVGRTPCQLREELLRPVA